LRADQDAAGPVAWIPKHPRLARLAEQIRQLHQRGHAQPPRCPSGLPPLDQLLGGGFVTGAVHELVAAGEAAATRSIAFRTAARAAGGHKWILYIDTTDDLYPPALAAVGLPLDRLLIVRAFRYADALWTGEQALRCRAIAAVVLPLRTLDARASRRLQLAAEVGQSLGLLLRSEQRGGPTFAATRLRCEPCAGLGGLRLTKITALKLRDRRPCAPAIMELDHASHPVSLPTVPGDRSLTA
jgi:hypothetical protein